jgi:hypothetical protein
MNHPSTPQTRPNAAQRELPASYHPVAQINLAEQPGLAVALNLVALALLGLSAALVGALLWLARPGLAARGFAALNASGWLGWGLAVLVAAVVTLLVHELIHGLFFWRTTGTRPSFGLGWGYAYAAAPQWYIARNTYQVIGLAPLIGIDLACLALALLGSPATALTAALTLTLNTSGAVGDLWIVAQVRHRSPACLVNDRGHTVTLYEPSAGSD